MQDTTETRRLERALLTYACQQGASRWDLRALGLVMTEEEPNLFHRPQPQKPERQLFRRTGSTARTRA